MDAMEKIRQHEYRLFTRQFERFAEQLGPELALELDGVLWVLAGRIAELEARASVGTLEAT